MDFGVQVLETFHSGRPANHCHTFSPGSGIGKINAAKQRPGVDVAFKQPVVFTWAAD